MFESSSIDEQLNNIISATPEGIKDFAASFYNTFVKGPANSVLQAVDTVPGIGGKRLETIELSDPNSLYSNLGKVAFLVFGYSRVNAMCNGNLFKAKMSNLDNPVLNSTLLGGVLGFMQENPNNLDQTEFWQNKAQSIAIGTTALATYGFVSKKIASTTAFSELAGRTMTTDINTAAISGSLAGAAGGITSSLFEYDKLKSDPELISKIGLNMAMGIGLGATLAVGTTALSRTGILLKDKSKSMLEKVF